MSYIIVVKIVGLKKTEKRANMQALCRQPPMPKVSLPSAADGKEATWQATVLPGRLTNLVSLPTVVDGIGFAVGGGRQRVKTLPTVADGKALVGSDVQLTSFGQRQRPSALCRQQLMAKTVVSHLTD